MLEIIASDAAPRVDETHGKIHKDYVAELPMLSETIILLSKNLLSSAPWSVPVSFIGVNHIKNFLDMTHN